MTTLKPKKTKPLNIKFPLKKSFGGAFQVNYETVDAIADDIRILLLTNYGERVMNYNTGANLRALLFEPDIGIKQQIIDTCTSSIEREMPFVVIRSFDVFTNNDDLSVPVNMVKINIHFSIGQTDLDGNLTFNTKV